MKKLYYVLFGIIIGVVLSIGSSAYAAELSSLIGKKIQSEWSVTLNGKNLGTALIVDGKSYAPVRVIGEAAGFDVTFSDKNVILKSVEKGDVPMALADVETAIEYRKSEIKSLTSFKQSVFDIEDKRKIIEDKIAVLEAEIIELEKQKADLLK
ncbi:hypothetical protein BK133_05050 [Paenibacillus sp. FSL H8-0548]|uniref:hypothetical protein n=1 Tax=Paenibacillus sp. FSL H8-0548 TaxID=1920422 RepID=UPI00096C3A79|nr:hypothetical protein [Paenibacillus sp. FSL H8-0548]OMF37424.1 hypothetical protein BK133_05050 [Paenibacillus sp. FSL H8-0548]